jgi:hypothetical protein
VCRAITTEPTIAAPPTAAKITVIIATASSVAEPRSRRSGFDRSDAFTRDGDPRQQRRSRGDPRDDAATAATQLEPRPCRPDHAGHLGGATVVTSRRQPRGLARCVHAPNLHRHGREARKAQDQDHDQRRNGERRLDRDTARIVGQTLVFNARVMMLVSALTIESPVTTVYRIAPNAAAAIVPMAYSTVDIPDSSTTSIVNRTFNRRKTL